jgi:hypothetical protein
MTYASGANMDGLPQILDALANAKTPLAVGGIVAVVAMAVIWKALQSANVSEKTRNTVTLCGFSLAGLVVILGFIGFVLPQTPSPPAPVEASDVTISGEVIANGDQRAGVAGAIAKIDPLVGGLSQQNVTTDANGEFVAHFKTSQLLLSTIWASDSGYEDSTPQYFYIDPAEPTPPKQFIAIGAQKKIAIASQSQAGPSTVPAPLLNFVQPASSGAAATPDAAVLSDHRVADNTADHFEAHAGPKFNYAMGHSPSPAQAGATAQPAQSAPPIATAPPAKPPQTDYDALFNRAQGDELALSNAATRAFADGQYAQVIRFAGQARKVSKTGVWKLLYPDLAASYFLTGQTQLGNATLAEMNAQLAADGKTNGLLGSAAARASLLHSIDSLNAPLSVGDRDAIARTAAHINAN